MNKFWKDFASFFWQDDFFWELVKAKSYTDEEIRKWSHLLKIARDYLSKDDIQKRNKYLKFCGYEKNQDSFDIGNSNKLQTFLTCEGLINNIFVLQKGKSKEKYQNRKKILSDYNAGLTYEELNTKYSGLNDFAANGRNALNWWDDWGYAVRSEANDKKYLFITEIGNDSCDKYDNRDACIAIFRDQIKKYQIPFFQNDEKLCTSKDFEGVKPYYAIIQVMLLLKDNFITKNEYVLFVNKIKNHKEKSISEAAELIEEYRQLTKKEQTELLKYIKFKDPGQRLNKISKIFSTISENSDKSLQAFMDYSGDLFEKEKRDGEFVYLFRGNKQKAEEIIKKFLSNPAKQYHSFDSIYEYNYAIGRREYETIEEILKRNYFNLNKKIPKNYEGLHNKQIDYAKNRALLELNIQKYFEENIEEINKHFDLKLEILERKGNKKRQTKEFDTFTVGEIDLLCKDKVSENYFVIEIKRDEADGRTLGQLFQYMGWVQKEFHVSPKGIIICRHLSEQYNFAKTYVEKNNVKLTDVFTYMHNFTDENLPTFN